MKQQMTQGLLGLAVAFILSSCVGSSTRSTENATSVSILNAVNRERVSRGLKRVVPDVGLREIARGHGGFLVSNVHPARRKPTKEVAHAHFQERAKRATKEGYPILSEVVMIGAAGDLSAVAERTIRGWLNSPSHRRAILNQDRRIMGVETRLPTDGRYFVVGLLSNGKVK